eukprot:gene1556-1802_t
MSGVGLWPRSQVAAMGGRRHGQRLVADEEEGGVQLVGIVGDMWQSDNDSSVSNITMKSKRKKRPEDAPAIATAFAKNRYPIRANQAPDGTPTLLLSTKLQVDRIEEEEGEHLEEEGKANTPPKHTTTSQFSPPVSAAHLEESSSTVRFEGSSGSRAKLPPVRRSNDFYKSPGIKGSFKGGHSVASLKPIATVKRDGKWSNVDAGTVVPGDLVLLACGSAIPADCRVNHGQIDVDQAQLTGESLPVTMYKGDSCKMGSTVVRGEVEGTVEFTGINTFFGKTASLLQGPPEHSNLQKILIRIMIVLVIVSGTLCTIVFCYLITQTNVYTALSFVVVLMVASIPLAIEIVTTTTLALGSKELSAQGAIVARL